MDEQSNNENLNSLNETAETDTLNEESVASTETEDVAALKAQLAQEREAKQKMFIRAKEAEGFRRERGPDGNVRWVKKEISQPIVNNKPPEDNISEELRLIARGLSDEDIDTAKVISKGQGISLQEAIKSSLFKAHQTVRDEEAKKESARLGASKGSGQATEESLYKPDMSRDEHLALFKKHQGQ
jgi:hypothetical protein